MGYFNTEEEASFIFGAAVSIAGILGTPLGGYLMDTYCVSTSARVNLDGKHHYNNTKILFLIMISSLIGTVLMCTVFWIEDKTLYIFVITMACILIFLAMSGEVQLRLVTCSVSVVMNNIRCQYGCYDGYSTGT